MTELLLASIASAVLAGTHLLTPMLIRMPKRYQARLASLSGGAGLSYIFLYLLFELVKDGASKIHRLIPLGPDPVETLFILLLAALSTAYILQVHLRKTPGLRDDHRGYVGFFFTYNVLVGAGLIEEARWGALNLIFYVAALGVHLLFNDHFVQHLCPGLHDRRWRSLLAMGPLLGTALAVVLEIPEGVLYALLALIAGGTLVNVLRRELPGVRSFRPLFFVFGVIGYAALIFATWRF